MGGDCLNTGCVPSKAILRSAKVASMMSRAEEFGIESVNVKPVFSKVMKRVHKVIETIEPHDSIERFTELGVDCVTGEAEIIDKHTVRVGDRNIRTKSIIIAAGARPFVPPIEGVQDVDYLTSDNVWELEELPKRLVVLGGGPIGCELSQAFAKLGSKVTMVEMMGQLMGREDPDVANLITDKFNNDGINVLTNHKAIKFTNDNGENVLHCETGNGVVEIPFDKVLIAVGRKANSDGMNLDKLGIKLRRNGTIETDEYLRTQVPNIFAVGDMVPNQYLVNPPKIDRTMSEYLIGEGVKSFAVSETQKFGHVTYFWNGNRSGYLDESLEAYLEIPSDNIEFNEAPAMKAREITDATIALIESGQFQFGRLNIANGDMVGHTGDLEAAIQAMEVVDECVAKLIEAIDKCNGVLIYTADHGNADIMYTEKDGVRLPKTSHTLSPVPFAIIDSAYQGEYKLISPKAAGLSNIAATAMNLLGFAAPEDYEPSLLEFI